MTLSRRSVELLGTALRSDFIDFLETKYFNELSELMSSAASEFIDEELGEVDDELFYDLAMALIEGVTITPND